MDEEQEREGLRRRAVELVKAYMTMAKALSLYEDTGDQRALLVALQHAEAVLGSLAEDDDLWVQLEGPLERSNEEIERWLGKLDQLLVEERGLLTSAGLPSEQAQQLLEDTAGTIRRYLERDERASIGEIRDAIYRLSLETKAARADLDGSLADQPEPPQVPPERRRNRYLRLAVRVVRVTGGIVKIVVDVTAAHATFGVTAVSVLDGAQNVLEGFADTG